MLLEVLYLVVGHPSFFTDSREAPLDIVLNLFLWLAWLLIVNQLLFFIFPIDLHLPCTVKLAHLLYHVPARHVAAQLHNNVLEGLAATSLYIELLLTFIKQKLQLWHRILSINLRLIFDIACSGTEPQRSYRLGVVVLGGARCHYEAGFGVATQ